MINIKKIIFITLILSFCLTKVSAAIKDSLFATVGNKAITSSDIINEIKTILILNGQVYSEDLKNQLEAAAIQSIVKRNIMQIEIEKYEQLQFNKKDLRAELNRLASNLNIDLDTLKNIFIANGVDFSAIKDRLETELLWNSLIFKLYKDTLTINLEEINEQLKLIQNKKEIEEYLISEIIIKPVPQDKLESEVKKIKNKINVEGFKKTAIDLSISQSSVLGGDLGWVSENTISKKFKKEILNTSIGDVSRPIFLPDGILFFKVRDKRKLKNIANLEEAKNQIVDAEKSKILNMHSLSHYDILRRSITIRYHQNE